MATGLDFSGMVPGLDFLQNLMKGASAALPGVANLPGIGSWVTPTLDPQELDKRINELRTVQFWLEQNAKLLGTTIQALEVQRMTLATLQTMNLPLSELRDALLVKPAMAPAPVQPPAAPPAVEAVVPPATPARDTAAADAPADAPAASAPPPAVDPMQWWGALTQQFTEIASQALQAGAAQQAAMVAAGGAAAGDGRPGGTPAGPAGARSQAKATPKPAAKTQEAAQPRGTARPARKAAAKPGPAAPSPVRRASPRTR